MAQATFAPGKTHADVTLSGGNLVATHDDVSSGGNGAATNHAAISTGKYYWEVVYDTIAGAGTTTLNAVGIIDSSEDVPGNNFGIGWFPAGYVYDSEGIKENNSVEVSYGNTYTDGDIIGVAFDATNGTLWFSKNGTWQNGADIDDVQDHTGTGNAAYTSLSGNFLIAVTVGDLGGAPFSSCTLRTTSGAMTYTIPTGFTADIDAVTNDGAVSMGMSASGTGTLPIRANGVVSANPGGTGTGTVSPIHGDGVASLNFTVAGVGTIPVRGNGAVSLNFTAQGTGTTPLKVDAAVSLAMGIAATGTTYPNFMGGVTLPLLVTAGSGQTGTALVGDFPLYLLETEGLLLTGEVGLEGDATLPLLTVDGGFGTTGAITLPSLEVAGTGLTGEVATLARTLQQLVVDGFTLNDSASGGVVQLPLLRVTGTIISDNDASAAFSLRLLKVAATGEGGYISDGAVTLPALQVLSLGFSDGIATAGLTLPELVVVGQLSGTGVTVVPTAWSMNTENYAAANYLNYDFHTIGQIGSQYIGVTATGIYVLDGSDDEGTCIDAEFLTGKDDFGLEHEKNVDKVYLGYTADDDLVLITNVDGDEVSRENDVTHKSHDGGLKKARVTLGKGVRSRYWQAGLRNCNGGDFEIEELGFLYRQLSRKI